MRHIALAAALTALVGCALVSPATESWDTVVLRVNCGAAADYVDLDGNRWLADRWLTDDSAWGAVGGATAERTGMAVAGTEAPDVYLSERYGMRGYEFRVPNGVYAVRPHFAETYEGAATKGARVFSVAVNDEEVLKDFDPFDAAGGLARPVVRNIGDVRVRDGRLRVEFEPNVQNPEVNGIEIVAKGITQNEAERMADELAKRPPSTAEDVGSAVLGDLRWQPNWVTRLGCIGGGLSYLGRDVSPPWLAGTSGYVFALNIHSQLCPSAPFVWDNGEAFDALTRNAGYTLERATNESEEDIAEARSAAWELVRRALNEGTPCFSFDIGGGEYFVVHGYDKGGYYYRGFDNSSQGPIPWQALGTTGIVDVVHMAAVRPAEPADDATAVREALQFALAMQQGGEDAPDDAGYMPGIRAYDRWIAALRDPESNPHGASFNAQYWAECRRLAVAFLQEASDRLGNARLDPLLEEAQAHYETVSEHLDAVAEALPMDGQWGARLKDAELVGELVTHLEAARAAEAKGLAALSRLLSAME